MVSTGVMVGVADAVRSLSGNSAVWLFVSVWQLSRGTGDAVVDAVVEAVGVGSGAATPASPGLGGD